jgi:DNA-binding NtrC family response regulator
MPSHNILIIDDDPAICTSLQLVLKRAGYGSDYVQRPAEVMDKIAEFEPDLVLLDMNYSIETSGREGLRLLRQIRELRPQLPIILMTGWATVQLAVEGMKAGARDFIAKPWDNKHLLRSIKTILKLSDGRKDTAFAESTAGFAHIVGQDADFRKVLATAERVAPTNASVLITGESGTGKELLAEAIHLASDRADGPFVKVNLGGIPESLFESEMFGHVKGAFTDARTDRTGRFALADGGTIFLDEIGDLPMANQVKLLRVLQEQTFEVLGSSRQQRIDVRVLSATNKPLDEMVAAGTFREDLLYRINLITLRLPSLRERPGDIPLLVDHFLDQIGRSYERPGFQLTDAAREWLKRQTFPGNIRQIKNLVERTVLLTDGPELDHTDFANHFAATAGRSAAPLATDDLTLEELEIQAVKRALSMHEGNITAAAQVLGITRSALYRRLEKYGLG